MSRKSVRKTLRNTVVEYSVPTIKDRKTSLSWIISVLQSPLLKIKNIALDDLSRSRYELGASAKQLSRKVFRMKGLEVNEVVIKFEPEEMKPHEELKVYSQKELNEKQRTEKYLR